MRLGATSTAAAEAAGTVADLLELTAIGRGGPARSPPLRWLAWDELGCHGPPAS